MKSSDLIESAKKKLEALDPIELMEAGLIPLNGQYFPSIYYPPIPMYPPSDQAAMFDGFRYEATAPCSVYIHVPFCRSRCTYCHWVVETGSSEERAGRYLASLAGEISILKKCLDLHVISPKSILIGGGTPSYLSPRLLKQFLDLVASQFDLSGCAQISCEVEPGTVLGHVGTDRLKALRDGGVDRICLGVQSFDDGALRDMGRMHTSREAISAVDQIRRAGFESLSVDLIYGYPGCTLEQWLQTLKTAFSLDVDACQMYRLRVVPHGDRAGAVTRRAETEPGCFPNWEQLYLMKQLGTLVAREAGLPESTRRVFSKGARHNSDYQTDHADRLYDVFGLGISSWSNLQGRFYLNTGQSLEEYQSYVARGYLPIDRGKIRTRDDERRRAVVVPLKHRGVSKSLYKTLTGCGMDEAFPEQLSALERFGLLIQDEERVRLTERGSFFADEVVMQFYHPDYLPFPRSAYAEGPLNPYDYDRPRIAGSHG